MPSVQLGGRQHVGRVQNDQGQAPQEAGVMGDLVEVEQAAGRDQAGPAGNLHVDDDFLSKLTIHFLSFPYSCYLLIIVQQGVDIDRQGPVHNRDVLAGILAGGRFKEAEQLALVNRDLL